MKQHLTGKDMKLSCDGVSCRVCYHRWCAGVTNKRYESLAGSEAPFLCPVCMMGQQSCVIAALQEAVKSLTIQVAELQLQHACSEVQLSQHARSEEQPSTMPPQKWNLMVRNGKGGCHRDGGYSLRPSYGCRGTPTVARMCVYTARKNDYINYKKYENKNEKHIIIKKITKSKDAAAKRRDTRGVGISNNYYEEIYIPPYNHTH